VAEPVSAVRLSRLQAWLADPDPQNRSMSPTAMNSRARSVRRDRLLVAVESGTCGAEYRDDAHWLEPAGVSVEFDLVPGAPHGFENWARDNESAKALMRRA
jgi:hypothetical protein